MQLRNRTNVLFYYTADEPDGSENPSPTPASARFCRRTDQFTGSIPTAVYSTLVLNYQDYFSSEYAACAPVLMQDTYHIGINAACSVVLEQSHTSNQGDCGSDNCVEDFEDIRNRMEDFATPCEVPGWERSTTVWTVNQGFGGSGSRCVEFCYFGLMGIINKFDWSRPGIGRVSLRAQSSWWKRSVDPTTPDIRANASAFAPALPDLTPFLLSSPLSQLPVHLTRVVTSHWLDFGACASADGRTLVMGTNFEQFHSERHAR